MVGQGSVVWQMKGVGGKRSDKELLFVLRQIDEYSQ